MKALVRPKVFLDGKWVQFCIFADARLGQVEYMIVDAFTGEVARDIKGLPLTTTALGEVKLYYERL